jgi:predicted transcriptional regulator
MVGTEKKNSTKFQIINYIINHKATSKVELSRNLNFSMPTVLSNVNELLASGIVVEMEMQSAWKQQSQLSRVLRA